MAVRHTYFFTYKPFPTSVVLGNGKSCLFWADRWIGNKNVAMVAPDLLNFVDRKIQNTRTVEQGLTLNA